MTKTINVYVDDNEMSINIRRLKYKEAKELIIELSSKVNEFITLFDTKAIDGEDIFTRLPGLLNINFSYFIDKFIKPYTSLKEDTQIDEIDMLDIFIILKELIIFNGIRIDQIINFFQDKEVLAKAKETTGFTGAIPKL